MLCETLHGGNSIRLNSTKLTTLRLQYLEEEYCSTYWYIILDDFCCVLRIFAIVFNVFLYILVLGDPFYRILRLHTEEASLDRWMDASLRQVKASNSECLARCDAFAAGLDELDLIPPNGDGMRCLGIYCRNCVEWIFAEQGCYAIGGMTSPFYDTLGPETVQWRLDLLSWGVLRLGCRPCRAARR